MNNYRPGRTIYFPFDTFKSADGSSLTMSGLAVGDIQIYKDGSVTQRGSTTGFTLLDTDGIDFDGVTGIHGFSVDLASDATGDFFKAGSTYWIVISAITVDGLTVNFVGERFTIGYEGALIDTFIATLASQTSFTLTSGPAEDDALNGLPVIVHDKASGVQLTRAVISDYTGATKTVTLRAVPAVTFTIAAGDNISIFPVPVQVDVTHISGAAVTGAALGANNRPLVDIDSTSFVAGAINAAAIAADAIAAAKIAAGALTAAKFAAGWLEAAGFAADTDIYDAKIDMSDDDAGTTDRWAVVWYKNGRPVVTGITVPLINVFKIADGTDLIASTAMTEIASTQTFRYSGTAGARIVSGVGYMAKVTATIGGSARTAYRMIYRDAA